MLTGNGACGKGKRAERFPSETVWLAPTVLRLSKATCWTFAEIDRILKLPDLVKAW